MTAPALRPRTAGPPSRMAAPPPRISTAPARISTAARTWAPPTRQPRPGPLARLRALVVVRVLVGTCYLLPLNETATTVTFFELVVGVPARMTGI